MRPTLPFKRSTQARKTARRKEVRFEWSDAARDGKNTPRAPQGRQR